MADYGMLTFVGAVLDLLGIKKLVKLLGQKTWARSGQMPEPLERLITQQHDDAVAASGVAAVVNATLHDLRVEDEGPVRRTSGRRQGPVTRQASTEAHPPSRKSAKAAVAAELVHIANTNSQLSPHSKACYLAVAADIEVTAPDPANGYRNNDAVAHPPLGRRQSDAPPQQQPWTSPG